MNQDLIFQGHRCCHFTLLWQLWCKMYDFGLSYHNINLKLEEYRSMSNPDILRYVSGAAISGTRAVVPLIVSRVLLLVRLFWDYYWWISLSFFLSMLYIRRIIAVVVFLKFANWLWWYNGTSVFFSTIYVCIACKSALTGMQSCHLRLCALARFFFIVDVLFGFWWL